MSLLRYFHISIVNVSRVRKSERLIAEAAVPADTHDGRRPLVALEQLDGPFRAREAAGPLAPRRRTRAQGQG